MFWNVHQSGNSELFACTANASPKAEITEIGHTANHFLEKSLKRLGVDGRISIAGLATSLLPIHYASRFSIEWRKKN